MPEDTKHSAIDPEGVLKRTVLRQGAHEHELDHEIKPAIMRLEATTSRLEDGQTRMETLLKVALAPRMVHPAVQGVFAFAAVVWTVVLVMIAVAVVHATPARASVPSITETARR